MFQNLTTSQMVDLFNDPRFALALLLLSAWALAWKGVALWKASQKGKKAWFVLLLILNTFGVVEILYIFWLSKYSGGKKEEQISTQTQQ